MNQELKNCWEIVGCGRENGGAKVGDLGECVSSIEHLGHNCWIMAGTYCEGEILGTCQACGVYGTYSTATARKRVRLHPLQLAELKTYNNVLISRRAKLR